MTRPARSIADLSPGTVLAPQHYLLRLVPPRPTFAFDMSDGERKVMADHAAYWMEKLRAGKVVMFGPVLDPQGPWGLAAVEVDSEEEMNAIKDGDPVLAGIPGMRWEVMPFAKAVVRPA